MERHTFLVRYRQVSYNQFLLKERWRQMLHQPSQAARDAARETIGTQLHVLELWMPQVAGRQNCNLACRHCYVPPGGRQEDIMSTEEYVGVLEKVMSTPAYGGRWDVVFPGMEPLMPWNVPLLLALASRAHTLGARSIGMTTNGVLLGQVMSQIVGSPISTINISLDGPEREHDIQRGRRGVFARTARNAQELHKMAPTKRLITNTTITRLNAGVIGDVVKISADLGCCFAAFHPFETADNADNALALAPDETALAIEAIVSAAATSSSSVAIEFEASTVGAFARLWERGIFADMELVADETGFLFLRKRFAGERELIVNIMFYPHHFIRTLRVMDDASVSSCRKMALCGWEGVGDLRQQSVAELLEMPESVSALAQIWEEFVASSHGTNLQAFFDFVESKAS